eukprot:749015-Hanusia_phi.AAC.1
MLSFSNLVPPTPSFNMWDGVGGLSGFSEGTSRIDSRGWGDTKTGVVDRKGYQDHRWKWNFALKNRGSRDTLILKGGVNISGVGGE